MLEEAVAVVYLKSFPETVAVIAERMGKGPQDLPQVPRDNAELFGKIKEFQQAERAAKNLH